MLLRAYNYATKQWEEIPASDVASKVGSGQYGLESGIRIPAISPSGDLGDLASEDAAKAFSSGYRIATPEDSARNSDIQSKKIEADAYNAPITAAISGGMSGFTLGGSDVIGNALGAGETLSKLQENNPIASGVGNLAGTAALEYATAGAATPLISAGETVKNAGVIARTGQALATPFATGGLAAKIAAGTGEGVLLGLGQGISEAALGDPNEVAENLMSNVGFGAILGGATGGLFAGAEKLGGRLLDASSRASEGIDGIVQSVAQKTAKNAIVPVISQGESKAAKGVAKELIDDPEFRQLYYNGGKEAFDKASDESVAAIKALDKDSKDTIKGLTKQLQSVDKQTQADVMSLVQDAQTDIPRALETAYQDYRGIDAQFRAALKGEDSQGVVIKQLYDKSNQFTDYLKTLKGADGIEAQKLAAKYENLMNAHIPPNVSTSQLPELVTIGKEIELARDLRAAIPYGTLKEDFTPGVAQKIREFRSDLDSFALKNHPVKELAATQRDLDRYYTAYQELKKFALKPSSGAVVEAGKNEAKNASYFIKKLQLPDSREYANTVLTNLQEFVPELKQVQSKLATAADKLQASQEFRNKLTQLGVDGTQVSSKDIADLATSLGSMDKIEGGLSKLQTLEQLKSADGSPIEKLIAIKKATGQPADELLKSVAENSTKFEKMSAIMPKTLPSDMAQRFLKAATKQAVKGALGYAAGSAISPELGAVGGLIGGMTGAGGSYRTLEALTKIEQMSAKSAKAVNKAVGLITKAATSDTARRITAKATMESASDRQKTFEKRSQVLSQFSDPNFQSAIAKKAIGGEAGIPNIQAAMESKVTAAGQFLASKLPQDPLKGMTLFSSNTGWKPSDLQLMEFERYYDAVNKPTSVLDNLAEGTVTPQEIEAIKTVYPQMYQKLQSQVLDAIIDSGKDLSYNRKIELSQLFEVPADISLQPAFVAAMQAQFEPDQSKQQPEGSSQVPQRRSALKLDTSALATQSQKIEGKLS